MKKFTRAAVVRRLSNAVVRVRLAATVILIQNPFQGSVVGWDWAEHVAAGYLGGTDYVFYPVDGPITAAADGRVTLAAGENGFTPGYAIYLTLADGRRINYREVASHTGTFPRNVKRGDAIGEPNAAYKWPHIDATVNGIRVPFEPLVNLGTSPAGGGGTPVSSPIPQEADEPMTDIIYYATLSAGPAASPITGPDGKPFTVTPESMWYQECPGAPLFPLTDNAAYGSNIEWLAFSYQHNLDGVTYPKAGRFDTSPANVAALLAKRGFASKPIGNFASGGASSGGPTLPQITTAVQSISDASDKNVVTALGTQDSTNTNLVLAAVRALVPGASLTDVQAAITAAQAAIIAKTPTPGQNAAATVSALGASIVNG